MSKSDPGLRRLATAGWRYGLCILLVALSTGVTLLLQDYTFRTPLFLLAILLSTWYGGTGPGLLAVLLERFAIRRSGGTGLAHDDELTSLVRTMGASGRGILELLICVSRDQPHAHPSRLPGPHWPAAGAS